MMKKILLVLVLFSAVQSFGQLNSIGLYAGFGSDKQSNPYDFRMKPVFELGAVYNQTLLFNLSMVLDLGISSQRIITVGSTAGYVPPDANYAYFNADVMFRYWLINDIKGYMSGKRSSSRVQKEILKNSIKFYLTGGFLNEFLVSGAGDEVESSLISGALGAGIMFYMPISNSYKGVSPFFEVLSTWNLTPRFTSATEELNFSRWMIRVGLTYSFGQT